MNKISKNDLLKLKDSKPIPITAHTHEVVVPVVYASKVNKFLKKEGIKLPLTHHQLADLKRKAAKVHGKMKEESESDNEEEGNSHARGTHSIKVSNVKGPVYINTQPTKAKRKRGKRAPSRKIITSASGLIPNPVGPRIQPPPSNTLRPNYAAFAAIRPQGITYSANTPTLHDIQKELQAEQKKEREALEKREKEMKEEGEKIKKNYEALTRALEAERRHEEVLIKNDTRLNQESAASSSSGYKSSEEEEEEVAAAAAPATQPKGIFLYERPAGFPSYKTDKDYFMANIWYKTSDKGKIYQLAARIYRTGDRKGTIRAYNIVKDNGDVESITTHLPDKKVEIKQMIDAEFTKAGKAAAEPEELEV